MNLPNVLTISRIVLAILLVFLLEERSPVGNILAFIVFAIASLTDFCDGHLARRKGLVSDFGKIMDPIADKILLLSIFGVFAHLGIIDWWMFGIVAAREVLITASRLSAMRQGQVLSAERAGKIKTVAQIIAVLVILLFLIASQNAFCSGWFYSVQVVWAGSIKVLMMIVVAITVYSGIDYFCHKKE